MPVEQVNISLPPKVARFIRGKIKAGHYTNASEVVLDAVRHMQEAEAAGQSLANGDPETEMTPTQRKGVSRRIQAGIAAIDRGEYTEHVGQDGLEALRERLIGTVQKAAKSRSCK
jgi:putative addiction module CopG family antidote